MLEINYVKEVAIFYHRFCSPAIKQVLVQYCSRCEQKNDPAWKGTRSSLEHPRKTIQTKIPQMYPYGIAGWATVWNAADSSILRHPLLWSCDPEQSLCTSQCTQAWKQRRHKWESRTTIQTTKHTHTHTHVTLLYRNASFLHWIPEA